jgi:hypothetical protein
MKNIDPQLILLIGSMGFFTVAIIYSQHMFNADKLFLLFSNVISGLLGAVLRHVSGKTKDDA